MPEKIILVFTVQGRDSHWWQRQNRQLTLLRMLKAIFGLDSVDIDRLYDETPASSRRNMRSSLSNGGDNSCVRVYVSVYPSYWTKHDEVTALIRSKVFVETMNEKFVRLAGFQVVHVQDARLVLHVTESNEEFGEDQATLHVIVILAAAVALALLGVAFWTLRSCCYHANVRYQQVHRQVELSGLRQENEDSGARSIPTRWHEQDRQARWSAFHPVFGKNQSSHEKL